MRKILTSLLVSLAILTVPALSQAASKASKRAGNEQRVLVLLNEIRAQHGLSNFTTSIALRNAANAHSADTFDGSPNAVMATADFSA